MIRNYFITALRNLWKNKFFSMINIFGLSIGISCCMLIFLYAQDEITFDKFHNKAKQIYRITADMTSPEGKINKTGSSGLLQGPRFTAGVPEIKEFVRVQSSGCDIRLGDEIVSQDALNVDDNFFSVFSFPLLYGDAGTALKDPYSIVISEDVATKFFGKKDVVGSTLSVKIDTAFRPFIVKGVAKNSPMNSSIKIKMLFSMKLSELGMEAEEKANWLNFYQNTFVVLQPGADPKTVAKKCNVIYNKEAAEQVRRMSEQYGYKEKITYGLQPLADMHLSVDYEATNGLVDASKPMYSYILSGIAVFILVIACINFVNLSVARSLKRAKEIGVRKVMGGYRRQLIFQFLGESFVLSFISFVLAIVITVTTLPLFNVISQKSLSFSYLLDVKLVTGYFILFVLTALLAGFYPSLVLSRFNPVETLYGKLRYSGKNYLSRALVVVQFSLATILIISTITIFRQFDYLTNYYLGYDKSNILRVNGGNMNTMKLEALKNELKKEPGIMKITAQQGGGYFTIAHINGDRQQEFGISRIDEEYFPMYKIPIAKGRNFSKEFPGDSTTSVLVNETFVKEAGWKNPIGEAIDFYYRKQKYNVVGVVKDFHTAPLTEKIKPYVFTIDPQLSYRVVFLKIDPVRKTAAMRHVEKTIRSFFPLIPYEYSFLEEDLRDQYKSEAKWKQIISFGAILTIFISCIGLFGLASLSAERRAKEIGIRKVLGASVSLIIQKLSADFIRLVIISAIIAMPIAWWVVNKWLDNYPYRIHLNATIFAVAIIGVLIIAFTTVSWQALKAATANPVKSLRTE